MKAIHPFKALTFFIAGLGLCTTLLTSCTREEVCPVPVTPARVSVTNALAGSQPINFFFDHNQLNYYGIPYGSGLEYVNAYTGSRTIDVYDTQTSIKIATHNTTFEEGKFYSVFLTGVPTSPDFMILNDDLTQPPVGNAGVRLVNLSPDAPAVDLVIQQGPTLASNIPYKGNSNFYAVAGSNTYNIEIRQAGTSNVLTSLNNVRFRNGSLYTVALEGFRSTTDGHILNIKIQGNVSYVN